MFEKTQFTWVNEYFEAIFDKDISSAAISRQRLYINVLKILTADASIVFNLFPVHS